MPAQARLLLHQPDQTRPDQTVDPNLNQNAQRASYDNGSGKYIQTDVESAVASRRSKIFDKSLVITAMKYMRRAAYRFVMT